MVKFMDAFTKPENQIVKDIPQNLQISLTLMREALKKLWASDAPRIVQDYTDHGVKHIERIASWIVKILKANHGAPLTVYEKYLLLGGIYIHDIGMQCDLIKYPQIKETASALGASFDLTFEASTASSYSIEEQKEIRRNHHFLSAAWISHAFSTGETVLGSTAKSIPEELVEDLMDVCMYHSKLNITDCTKEFRFDPTGRKRLIAALLRFADELDIDSNRVEIDSVRTFSISPENSIYWWLHHQTKIVFTAENVLLITVRLHPEDFKRHERFIYDLFINKFKSKNEYVINVLAEYGIPLIISSKSKVVDHSFSGKFPDEISQVLLEVENPRSLSMEEDQATHAEHLKQYPTLPPELQRVEQLACGVQIQNYDLDERLGNLEHNKTSTSTLGCFVKLKTGQPALLTTYSSLAEGEKSIREKDRILQPANTTIQRGDVVAVLHNFVSVQPAPAGASPKSGDIVYNEVDGAVAELIPGVMAKQSYLKSRNLPDLTGTSSPRIGDKVFKVGCGTGLTYGKVILAPAVVGPVYYRTGACWFKNCFVIEGFDGAVFSDRGDSGAAVVRETGEVLGLIFAGNRVQSFACEIDTVLHALDCTFM